MELTDKQLRLICPRLPSARRAEFLPLLNAAMGRFGIGETKFRVAAYLANLMHESRNFMHVVESLDYSAKRLTEVWPRRFLTLASAQPYARNPRALAGKVYAGRMGNRNAEDAFNYIGRGGIQRTGRKGYARATEALGVDFITQPELLERPEYFTLSDALYWSDNGLNGLADCLRGKRDPSEQKTLTAICERINGGRNGLPERVAFYWRVLSVLNQEASAVVASAHLDQWIAASPKIPTPETHSQKRIEAEARTPTPKVAKEEVQVQESATSIIDIAEATPASVMRASATSLWSRTGGRIIAGGAWLLAALKAGEFAAWLTLAVLLALVVWLVIKNRHDLRRWWNVGLHKVKEVAVGA